MQLMEFRSDRMARKAAPRHREPQLGRADIMTGSMWSRLCRAFTLIELLVVVADPFAKGYRSDGWGRAIPSSGLTLVKTANFADRGHGRGELSPMNPIRRWPHSTRRHVASSADSWRS